MRVSILHHCSVSRLKDYNSIWSKRCLSCQNRFNIFHFLALNHFGAFFLYVLVPAIAAQRRQTHGFGQHILDGQLSYSDVWLQPVWRLTSAFASQRHLSARVSSMLSAPPTSTTLMNLSLVSFFCVYSLLSSSHSSFSSLHASRAELYGNSFVDEFALLLSAIIYSCSHHCKASSTPEHCPSFLWIVILFRPVRCFRWLRHCWLFSMTNCQISIFWDPLHLLPYPNDFRITLRLTIHANPM